MKFIEKFRVSIRYPYLYTRFEKWVAKNTLPVPKCIRSISDMISKKTASMVIHVTDETQSYLST